MNLLQGPLSVGELLDGAFQLYRRRFMVIYLTALITLLPASLSYLLWWGSFGEDVGVGLDGMTGAMVGFMLAGLVNFVVLLVALSALAVQFGATYGGLETSVGQGIVRGLGRLPSLVGATIIALVVLALVTTGVVLMVTLVTVLLASRGIGSTVLAIMLSGLAVAVVVVFLLSGLFAVIPAAVLEKRGPWGSLARSWRLGRGSRLRILLVLVVSWLITMLPVIGIMIVTGAGGAMIDPTGSAFGGTASQMFFQQMVSMLVSAATTPYTAGCMVLLYFDARVRLEGYDLELAATELAGVGGG
jgi:hypothetical protein